MRRSLSGLLGALVLKAGQTTTPSSLGAAEAELDSRMRAGSGWGYVGAGWLMTLAAYPVIGLAYLLAPLPWAMVAGLALPWVGGIWALACSRPWRRTPVSLIDDAVILAASITIGVLTTMPRA